MAFLRSLGISEVRYLGRPAVRFPYLDEHGTELAVRFRLALTGDERFRWRRGAKTCPYGLQRLGIARAAGWVVLGEGESDLQTMLLHDTPALTLPGADMWREEYADYLDGIAIIYVIVEPDKGGKATLSWLSRSAIRDRVRLVELGEYKDPSGLYLDDPATFRERFQSALDAAVPWSDHEQAEGAERSAQAWALCADLARQTDILARFADDLARSGVAGESRVAKLIYLVVTSRLLSKPVSLAVKGPSSGGKSYLLERVLGYFPASAYYALSAMSERALAYSQEPLSHRMLVIYEASGLQGDLASYLIRSILSEGRVRYETVEKVTSGLRARLMEREVPTGLITTTTAVHLHAENETRLLSVQVTDTPEQTRNVLLALAEDQPEAPQYAKWHALQEWLEGAEHSVIIPYATSLADGILPAAFRYAVEFRHRSRTDQPDALQLLRSLNMGLAMAHHPWYARIREATTDFAYLRLLGRRDVFPDFGRVHRPQDDALRDWAGFLVSLPPQVTRAFVFINNQFEGHSPATVQRMRTLLAT